MPVSQRHLLPTRRPQVGLKKTIVLMLIVALVAALGSTATAGKKKKKGPKPFTSSEGLIGVPHTVLYSSSGEVNSVTAKEFEARCAIPASNGLDAYVWEVPAEYQAIESNIETFSAGSSYDLYAFFYKEDCTLQAYSLTASGSTGLVANAPKGIMPAGTAYVLMANFLGDPAAAIHFELKP
jgi:hypothetical protein